MPTRGSKDPNGRALRGRRAHTTFALLTDPARQIWNSFNNRANAGSADAPEAAVNGCLYDRFKSLYNKTATKPSLVIVPARFKSGTLYSQIPSSNADFTVTRPLNTATRFDSSALIQTGITSGIPRLDYYTSGGVTGCPALLVEPAATNLCLQSEAFNTTWTNVSNNLSISANVTSTLDPAGGNTAELLTVVTGSTQSQLSQDITTVSGTAYVFSFFGKKGSGATELNSFRIFGSSIISSLTINWDTGVITHTAGSGATSQNFGNGWWRIVIPFTANSTTTTVQIVAFATYATALSSLRWGAQLETGSVATSYIHTTTAAITRGADVVEKTGVSSLIGQTEGTIYAELDFSRPIGSIAIVLGNGSSENFRIRKAANFGVSVQIVNLSGSATLFTSPAASAGIYKVAFGYKNGDHAMSINGAAVLTSTDSTNFPFNALDRLLLGQGIGGVPYFNDRIRSVALYTTRLTNAELAFITQP